MKIYIRVAFWLVLLLAVQEGWSATVTNLAVPSPAMQRDIPVTVILPNAFSPEGARLPVL